MTHPPLFHCSWSKTSGVPLLLHLCFEISHGKHWKTAARPVPVLQSQSFGLQIMGCREVLFPINPSGLSPCFRQCATLLDVVFLMFLIGFWKSFSHWLHWLQRYRKVFSLHVHQSTPFITISMMYLLLVSKLGAGNLFHEATFGRQPVTSLGLVLWPIDPPTYGGQMPPALRSSYPAVG